MKPEFRVRICTAEGERFFGEGPWRLLRGVERLGSLRAAAGELGMAYSKASRIVARAERVLGAPLTERRVGGPDGGGSALTPLAREWLARYEAFRDDCAAAVEASFARRFGDLICPETGVTLDGSSSRPSAEECPPEANASPEGAEPTPREPGAAHPNSSYNNATPGPQRQIKLGCVVLAAGRSCRFGANKLLAELGGRPVLARTLDALPEECFCRAVVVTSDAQVSALCRARGLAVREYPGGPLSDSIREGLAEMAGTDGCMFVNGDQPLLRPTSLRRLAAAFAEAPDCAYRLAYGGIAASPVVIPASAYPALRALTGESGGMAALRSGNWKIRTVEANAESELWDVDDETALRRAEERLSG